MNLTEVITTQSVADSQFGKMDEDYEKRAQELAKCANPLKALSIYLGGKITPICGAAKSLAEITFSSSLLFVLDDAYVCTLKFFGTYDGYDAWEISIAEARFARNESEKQEVEIFGSIRFEGIPQCWEFTSKKNYGDCKPVKKVDLAKTIIRRQNSKAFGQLVPPNTLVGNKTLLKVATKQFCKENKRWCEMTMYSGES